MRIFSLWIAGLVILAGCTAPPVPVPTTSTPTPLPVVTIAAISATQLAASPPVTVTPVATQLAESLPDTAALFHDDRLTYEAGFYGAQIQALLETHPGPLKDVVAYVGDRRYPFAEALVGPAVYYGVNPKLVLAIFDQQAGLLSDANATSDNLAWAAGYRGDTGNRRGLQAQTRWLIKELFFARRDYPARASLRFADDNEQPPPADVTLAEYMLLRVLAPTTTADRVVGLRERVVARYTALFEDPRQPPIVEPLASEPFLSRPLRRVEVTTSFFDHSGPFLMRDARAGVLTYWGRVETDPSFAYNGHDGWDYAADGVRALAAAPGVVAFAGNADDGCATRAVIVDHENGYRSLYWHLNRVDVVSGQRVSRDEWLGVLGNSGCSTGPHLHFGVQYRGRTVDPYGWCGAQPDPWAQRAGGAVSVWLWEDRPSPCAPPPAGYTIVDLGDSGYTQTGDDWQQTATGYGGNAAFVRSRARGTGRPPWDLAQPPTATWRAPDLPGGRYEVLVYIPYALSGLPESPALRYRVRHAGGEEIVVVDAMRFANEWASLGIYQINGGQAQVRIDAGTRSAGLTVWADAVAWRTR